MPTLTRAEGLYQFLLKEGEEDTFRASGFYWDSIRGRYVSPSHAAAYRYREYSDFDAKRALKKVFLAKDTIERGDYEMPKGEKLKPIQQKGMDFVFSLNRVYLGFDPGLGKSVIAAMASKAYSYPIVYVTPPSVMENIRNEFSIWAPELRGITVYDTRKKSFKGFDVNILFVSDSLISSPDTIKAIKEFIMHNAERDPILIIDEAHRFKNWQSRRSKTLYGDWKRKVKGIGIGEKEPGLMDIFEKIIFMSGSPVDKGIMDLYAVLYNAAPETISFMNKMDFARYYCGAYLGEFGKLVLEGTPPRHRVKELAEKVMLPNGRFMYRVKKKDSGIEFPKKLEQFFVLSGKMGRELQKMDGRLKDHFKKYESGADIIKEIIAIQNEVKADKLHVMEYRKLLAKEKVRPAAKYIEYLLKSTKEQILIFGIHIEALEELTKALQKYEPALIYGGTDKKRRFKLIQEFQNGKRRVIIGNIKTMGVGFTVTKAHRVLMFEYDWNPGVNGQAIDRAYRIGRDESLLVQYLVFKDSFDIRALEGLEKKQKTIDSFEGVS